MRRELFTLLLSHTILFSLFAVVITITPIAEATTIYVNDDSGADFEKIQDAINASSYGDTIYVYNGFYEENLTLKDGISLIGEMPNRPVLDGTNLDPGNDGRIMIIPGNNTSIEGFYIQNVDKGIRNKGKINVTIHQNIFKNINWSGIHNSKGATSYILNNIFINTSYGIYSVAGSGGSSSSNDSIVNNVFDLCDPAIYGPTGIQRILNNIIVNGGDGLSNCDHSETYIDHNLFWNNTKNYYNSPSGPNDIIADPKFENNSYNLSWDSPAIDTGTDLYAPLVDFENEIRPYDGDGDNIDKFDIGIDEKVDISPPSIILNSPMNNSIIPSGTILDFIVLDPFLVEVDYSINAGPTTNFPDPFDIDTSGWIDDTYIIEISANDTSDHWAFRSFEFIIDSTKPSIILNSPVNNSIFSAGTIIDLEISDIHLDYANYSTNGSLFQNIPPPYDIDTSGWPDGPYTIDVRAVDLASNLEIRSYMFTIDSTPPNINLTYPVNNSIITAGTFLDFEILDTNLDEAKYSINGGLDTDLDSPYDIDTSGWDDGEYIIEILANDLAGNAGSKIYGFTFDSTKPEIFLNSPDNNSTIKAGEILDFDVFDVHLNISHYSINGEASQEFDNLFNISTIGWIDGTYSIEVQALDLAGNFNTNIFNFTVDSTPPEIDLNSPDNNSYITSEEEIDLTIIDNNLDFVSFSKNSQNAQSLLSPYNIDISSWSDGEYTITVYAEDLAGNSNERWFVFTKDTTIPEITLTLPQNDSLLLEASTLEFDISDSNLETVKYSINQVSFIDFKDPYELDTTGWDDGEYIITIKAEDMAGHVNEKWFLFRMDTTIPTIDSASISENAKDIDVNSEIVLEFSEPMDIDSVENAISISPSGEYTIVWGNNNRTLTITFSEPLEYDTSYSISISTKAKEMTGRDLEDNFELDFTTEAKPIEQNGEEFPIIFLLLIIIGIIVAILIVVLVMSKKKKAPVSGVDSELFGGVEPTPQTIQITCSNCRNLLQVNDMGVSQNVTCPYCSTLLTVPSQMAAAPNIQPQVQAPQPQVQPQTQIQTPVQPQTQPSIQPQQTTIQISCPNCRHKFPVVKGDGPTQVQCPNCHAKGTI